MSWLGPLPFEVPFLPGLSGALLLWATPFLFSTLYVLPMTVRAWASYVRILPVPDAEAERLYALGQALARSFGVLMVLAGLTASVVAAITPPVLPRRPLTATGAGLIMTLVLLSVLVAAQSGALELSQRAAAEVLRKQSDKLSSQ